ncbi:hypothetical protein AGABI1DRAFT_125876 [Agaricus bisporus var. burnettii JB137-S8]|uniref:F-box domain-containing protein n=2 Tax=Agaricus bisporus var. burnettii TaxID=192524 RepID=K5XE77_AGABU|nr:uncharacterized protein AGABI1DRAFT_125876 [Agaricus bisporus var. burnettii JB137-S8]EKM81492.1 hypothetical protein AGABI1DRAFT_125876 [Agaricus bisporus var. burnettii JB137-S8]KAF7770825.1 hypothetical protein Agabi119p4_6799 [Agaricus bisporus var. burnettii]
MPLLRLWLIRSKDAPLTILLDSMANYQDISLHKILHLLLQHSWRWKRFIVDIHGHLPSLCFSSELASLLLSKKFKFPVLERVAINFCPQPSDHTPHSTQLCNVLYEIPSLLSVVMPVPCLKHHATLTEILVYSPVPYNDVLKTLACCPNLQSMDICLSSYSPYSHYAGWLSINHQKLSSLRVRSSNDDSATALRLLLDNLTLAHLTELEILSEDNTIEDIRAIYKMILRSNCYLKALSKLHVFGHAQEITRLLCLPQLHSLQRLSLRRVTNEILEYLTLQRSGGARSVVLPSLEFLELDEIVPPMLGSTLSHLLVSRFDSLLAANVVMGNQILHTPLDNVLWSHPGYRIMIQGGDKCTDLLLNDEDGSCRDSWDERSWSSQLIA